MKFLLYPEFYLLGSAFKETMPGFTDIADIAAACPLFDAVVTFEVVEMQQ